MRQLLPKITKHPKNSAAGQMKKPRVLVIDDEEDIRVLLRMWLESRGFQVREAEDLASGYRRLDEGDFDLCLTDMRLPDGNGIELVRKIGQQKPKLPVAVITAYGSVETAVDALKAGAFDFISKPLDFKVLQTLIDNALQRSTRIEPRRSGLVGASRAVAALREQVSAVAANRAPIVVTGESGTQKEQVAREIHRLAASAERPFVAVNCPALALDKVEDAFFGTEEGAESNVGGFLRDAQGGTLFLREVASLPPFMQARLLDSLQQRSIPRAGGALREVVDFRLIASSTGDLQQAVGEGRFRDDLFYRLNVITVEVPPLRAHLDDLPDLCDLILSDIARRWDRSVPRLSDDSMVRLRAYSFPGNLRELENILERAVALARGDVIIEDNLAFPTGSPAAGVASGGSVAAENLQQRLEADERSAIIAALEKTRWNRTAAARLLGITFRQLRYRIKKFGLDSQEGAQ